MHKATTAVGHQVGLSGDPAVECHRPLARSADVEDLLARLDHAAVHDPGGYRRHLASCNSHHRLVEKRQALSCIAHSNQDAALTLSGDRHQLRIVV
jgi:hypothetical protein